MLLHAHLLRAHRELREKFLPEPLGGHRIFRVALISIWELIRVGVLMSH